MTTKQQLQADQELIYSLGGLSALAKRLGFASKQRVHNWLSRGIPASVKLQYPKVFLRNLRKVKQ